MTIGAAEIMNPGGRGLPLARDLREALAIYARRTWPTHTSSYAAKAWGISKDTAKNLLRGSASDTTVTAILRAGGWRLATAVIGATIGQSLEDWIASERERLARERRSYEDRERALVAMASTLAVGAGMGLRRPSEPDLRDDREDRPRHRRMGGGRD